MNSYYLYWRLVKSPFYISFDPFAKSPSRSHVCQVRVATCNTVVNVDDDSLACILSQPPTMISEELSQLWNCISCNGGTLMNCESQLDANAYSTMTRCLAPPTLTTSWIWILIVLFKVLSYWLRSYVLTLQAPIRCVSVLHRDRIYCVHGSRPPKKRSGFDN